jgi:hypothetical protein
MTPEEVKGFMPAMMTRNAYRAVLPGAYQSAVDVEP